MLTAGALLAAGCSNASDNGGGAVVDQQALALFKDMTPASNAKTVDTAHYKTDKTKLTIGYVDFGLVNSWRVQALGSAKQMATKLGVDLISTDAGGDATKQISDAEDILARGVDALLISPVSPEAVVPVIERAYNSGIPVIIWGSDANTDKYTAKVVADDRFFGEAGGKKLVEDLGGKGKVIMLRGIAGNSVETARYEGAVSAFKGTNIEIVGEEYGDWAFDKGKSATENLLAAHPQIDGVWSSGAAMTRGAIEAFQEAKRPLVPMSGENLNGFLKLAAQLNLKTAAPQFPTWQAPEALKLAVRALRGLSIESSYLLKPPPVTDAKASVVADASDDYWVEDYLTHDQILDIFPNK
jgi:ribose transport system substrate-binding protein